MTRPLDHTGQLAFPSEPNSAAPLLLPASDERRAPTAILSSAKDGAVASRDLLRHEAQPGGEVTAIHEWLKKQGFFERNASHIETGNAAVFRYARASYPYSLGGDHVDADPALF